MITQLPVHVVIAMNEIGTHEMPGPLTDQKIAAYLETVGMPSEDEIPWCSAFVNWLVRQVGLNGTDDAAAISWQTWGRKTFPRMGSIAVMHRGGESWMRHVGILLDSHAGMVRLLGGNQSDRVGIKAYPASRFTAFRWDDRFEYVTL